MSPDPLTISSCDRLASACVDAAMGFGGGAARSGDSADPQSIISKGSAHQLADLIYRLAMADPPGPAFWTRSRAGRAPSKTGRAMVLGRQFRSIHRRGCATP